MVTVPGRAHPTPVPPHPPPSVFLGAEGVRPAEADARQSWAGDVKVSKKHMMCK